MLKKLIYFALLGSMAGQVNVTLLPPTKTCLESAGSILSGGSVSTFAAGTTTPLASYTDSTGTVQNANPVILDSSGCANVWLGPSSYKIVVKKSDGTTVYTTDGINGAFLNFLSLNGGNALTAIADPAASLGKFWLSLTTTGRLKYSDASAIHTIVGADTTDTETNKTLTSPAINTPNISFPTMTTPTQSNSIFTIGVYPDASGFKHKRVASCTTGAGANAVCNTTVTWGTTFADGNYTAVCTLVNGAVSGGGVTRIVGVALAASVTVEITNGSVGGANNGTVNCIAVHD